MTSLVCPVSTHFDTGHAGKSEFVKKAVHWPIWIFCDENLEYSILTFFYWSDGIKTWLQSTPLKIIWAGLLEINMAEAKFGFETEHFMIKFRVFGMYWFWAASIAHGLWEPYVISLLAPSREQVDIWHREVSVFVKNDFQSPINFLVNYPFW